MDAFTDPKVERIVLMFAAQMGKSEGLIANVVGYHIDQDPAPLLVVQPREADAKKFSKVRLAPMIRDTPRLKGKVREPKTKDSNNTILEKSYPGGRLILGGANSPANLAGDPIRIVLLDEVDRFPPSAGTEGDPVELAEARTATFSNRKIVLTSTPTEEETSRIAKAYEDSDQRVFFVPCAHCGESQTLKWAQVQWERDDEGNHLPETAAYFCEHCGAKWTEAERHQSVRLGQWKATKESKGTAGFHLNALYAPWSNLSLANLADKFVKAKRKPLLLRAFTNTVLAETWHEKYESIDETGLADEAEEYPRRDGVQLVPTGAVVLTAGVDVQMDRIEASAFAWGRSEECWVLSHIVLPGSPGSPDVWQHLWEWMSQSWPSAAGPDLYLRATCIDTGGQFTQASYAFINPRIRYQAGDAGRSFTFGIKGMPGQGNIWPNRPSRTKLSKQPLYPIRVAPAKEVLYTRLQKIKEPGPGKIHFPTGMHEDYFKQLTSQRVVTKYDARGFGKRVWELKQKGGRDETLDCWVYGYAGLCGLESMGFNLDREADRLEVALENHEAPPAESTEPTTPTHPTTPAPILRPPGGGATQRRGNVSRSKFLGR